MKLQKALTIIVLLLIPFVNFAQGTKKLDKIIKRDYQIIECTIAKISDKTVEYSLPGETV